MQFETYEQVILAHGSGGRLMQELIQQLFLPIFRNPWLEQLADAAILEIDTTKLAFSTDSYVVDPIFFPGGDIGRLAVAGTVNDLAMMGARPLFLLAGFILEEGLDLKDLERIVSSMQKTAKEAGVWIVGGDTKVVERGKADKIFINISGMGPIIKDIGVEKIRPGDKILINGPLGLHGIAVLSARAGLKFDRLVESDTGPVNSLIEKILNKGRGLHCLRDPTRGGLANTLNEIAQQAKMGIVIQEEALPVPEEVRNTCDLLGLDPLYVANEGKFIAFVDPADAEDLLAILRGDPRGREATIIGEVVQEHPGTVIMLTRYESYRLLDMLTGEQLPRIC